MTTKNEYTLSNVNTGIEKGNWIKDLNWLRILKINILAGGC